MGRITSSPYRPNPLHWLLAVAIVLVPTTALADAGIPMLALVWPATWALFIPIVLVESAIAARHLGVPWRRAFKVATLANLVSTLVGIPLTWAIGVFAESMLAPGFGFPMRPPSAGRQLLEALVMAPWLGTEAVGWMVPVAALVLCVPFFLVSVWVEFRIANLMLHEIEETGVKGWAWRANAATYGGIVVLLLGLLAWTLRA